MDVINEVPLPEKTGAILDSVRRVLLGTKNIPAHELEKMRKLVTETGYAHSNRPGGFVNGVKGIVLGGNTNPLGVLKARIRQGGVFGKGGILHGDIALSPETVDTWRKVRGGDHSFKNYASLTTDGLGQAANLAFGPGLPAAALAGAAMGTGTWGDAGAEGASLLGYALGAPFGLVGNMVGGSLGSMVGDKFRAPDPDLPTHVPDVDLHGAQSVVRSLEPVAQRSFQRFEAPEPEIYLPEAGL